MVKVILRKLERLIDLKLKEIELKLATSTLLKNEIWKEGYLKGIKDATEE